MTTILTRCSAAMYVSGILLLTGCSAVGRSADVAPAAGTSITRDAWGVPYIDAADRTQAAYALGWAMAEDGFAVMEDAYATALGQAAAYHGEGAVASDMLRLSTGSVAHARQRFADADAEVAAICNAFAAAVNDFIRAYPEVRPLHFARFDGWMVYAFTRDAVLLQPLWNDLQEREGGNRNAAFIAAVPPPTADGRALFIAGGAMEHPYEFDIRLADGARLHGITAVGSPFMMEGYTRSVAFARTPLLSSTMSKVSIDASGAGGGREDSLRVNTADGVVTRRVRIAAVAGGGAVVAVHGDTAIVVPHGGGGDVVQQLHAMTRVTDAMQAADVAGADGHALSWMHPSGATNVATPTATPRARADAALHAWQSVQQWSLASLTAIAFDSRFSTADTAVAGLVDEWEQIGARNSERAFRLDSAIALLRDWDRRAAPSSVAATLFVDYMDQLAVMQSDGAYARFRAMERVIADRTRFPPRPWGVTHPVARAGSTASIPAAAAPARHGIMFAYDTRETRQRYVWAVNLTDGVAASVLSYGQSWLAESRHRFDQAPLFAAATLKPVAAPDPATSSAYRPGIRRN